ncbi:uncharacterized protein LOC102803337 [Saccoglossus kowalevskii]|uniref:Uncharacterized protein LOC102803337 n=1 Tax=Saccoglossus kowalevskii TaxID=10224 RepID=A0ABM0M999_SACKO|nr:PREDICTED: uncharacterized protein LOC102803337 [Saccoglossus kowalevskii]
MSHSGGKKVRTLAHQLLDQDECMALKTAMRSFCENHSVLAFCTALHAILNTTEKQTILSELYVMVPDHLKTSFQQLCDLNFGTNIGLSVELTDNDGQSHEPQMRSATDSQLRRSISETDQRRKKKDAKDEGSKKRDKKDRKRTKSEHDVVTELLNVSSENDNIVTTKEVKVRKVKLEHKNGHSLGFCIRGGVDLRTGIFISQVDSGSQAQKKGLKTGERILKVNDTAFKNITHAEAVVALKSAQKLTLYVAPLGQMPGANHHILSSHLGSGDGDALSPSNKSNKKKNIILVADDDGWLGCSIRGGTDYNMDVTVANVDPMSPAHRAGLKRGQQILGVNDVDVRTLTHLQIVNLVTASNVVKFIVLPPSRSGRSSSISTCPRQRRSESLDRMAGNNRHQSRTLPTQKIMRRNSSPAKSQPDQLLHQPPRPTTPLRAGQIPHQILEQELQSTTPLTSSTPLPPTDHPALLRNRDLITTERTSSALNHTYQELQDLPDIQVDARNVIVHRTNASERCIENDTAASPHGLSKEQEEKLARLQQGTLGRNMDRQLKNVLSPPKFSEENLAEWHCDSKVHVKNLFNSSNEKLQNDDSLEELDLPMFSPKSEIMQSGNTGRTQLKMNITSIPDGSRSLSMVIPLYDTHVDSYSKVLNLPVGETIQNDVIKGLPKSTMPEKELAHTISDVKVDVHRRSSLNAQPNIVTNESPNVDSTEKGNDWRLW